MLDFFVLRHFLNYYYYYFVAFTIWVSGPVKDARKLGLVLRLHPHGRLHVADSLALDLTCLSADVDDDVVKRGFALVVIGTWY